MQKLKFMQEFTFAINVERLRSDLLAKLLLHTYIRAKHVAVAYKRVYDPSLALVTPTFLLPSSQLFRKGELCVVGPFYMGINTTPYKLSPLRKGQKTWG